MASLNLVDDAFLSGRVPRVAVPADVFLRKLADVCICALIRLSDDMPSDHNLALPVARGRN